MTIDDQSEVSSLVPWQLLPLQPVFVGFIHRMTQNMYFCGVIHRDAGG